MLGIMWVSWRASQGIGVFWRRWVRMKWFLSLEQTITSGPFLMAMVKDWRVPTCFAKSWFGFWTCDTPWKLLLFSIGTDEILPWDWNGRWRNDRIFKVLSNCEAKMGPAAHLLVNETSLSSTSNEPGQADHGAVWGKELVSIERGKCYHKTSSLLGGIIANLVYAGRNMVRARVNIVARAERLGDEELSSTHRPAMRLLDISMCRHGHAARLHRKRGWFFGPRLC